MGSNLYLCLFFVGIWKILVPKRLNASAFESILSRKKWIKEKIINLNVGEKYWFLEFRCIIPTQNRRLRNKILNLWLQCACTLAVLGIAMYLYNQVLGASMYLYYQGNNPASTKAGNGKQGRLWVHNYSQFLKIFMEKHKYKTKFFSNKNNNLNSLFRSLRLVISLRKCFTVY